MTEAGNRLKRVLRKRFKYVEGVESFKIHKGECIKVSEEPAGPCTTWRNYAPLDMALSASPMTRHIGRPGDGIANLNNS